MSDYHLLQEVGALQMGDPYYVDDLGAMPMPQRYGAYAPAPAGYGYPPMRYPARPPMPQPQQLPYRRLVPQVPGAPAIGLRLQPMGIGSATFDATSGLSLPVSNRPQRPFKGKRLIISIARTGASATGLVTVESLNVGTNNQFVATGPIGADAFAPNAFDTNLELAACTTALDISVLLSISVAPAMTDRVDVNATLIGEAIG